MLKIYSIYDRKSHTYCKPFFFTADGEAVRAFMSHCVDPQSTIYHYASDYELVYLGEFDPSNGAFGNSQPSFLMRGDQAQEAHARYVRERTARLVVKDEDVTREPVGGTSVE